MPEGELTETDVGDSGPLVKPSVVPMEPEDLDEEGKRAWRERGSKEAVSKTDAVMTARTSELETLGRKMGKTARRRRGVEDCLGQGHFEQCRAQGRPQGSPRWDWVVDAVGQVVICTRRTIHSINF